MSNFDMYAHSQQIPQQSWALPPGNVPGQPASGPSANQPGAAAFPQPNLGGWNGQPNWNQPQRQLSQQDVGEIIRQLAPLLPQLIAQAQQPQAAYGQFGAPAQQARSLTPQDVNDVVRQILPILPQIVSMLQNQVAQPPMPYGGLSAQAPWGQAAFGPQSLGQVPGPQSLGQVPGPQSFGLVLGQQSPLAAYGAPQAAVPQQRQLSQEDISEVARQLLGLIPQVVNQLQTTQTRAA
jgi:hypothetical protein